MTLDIVSALLREGPFARPIATRARRDTLSFADVFPLGQSWSYGDRLDQIREQIIKTGGAKRSRLTGDQSAPISPP